MSYGPSSGSDSGLRFGIATVLHEVRFRVCFRPLAAKDILVIVTLPPGIANLIGVVPNIQSEIDATVPISVIISSFSTCMELVETPQFWDDLFK